MNIRTITVAASLLLLLTTVSCSSSSNSTEPAPAPKGGGVQQDSTSQMSTKQAEGQLTTEQKLEDFEYMYKIIEENYPFLKVNERVNGIDWLGKKEFYRKLIEQTPDDREFFNTLRLILNGLKNGHTRMLDEGYYMSDKMLYTDVVKSGNSAKQPWLDVLNKEKVIARYSANKSASPNQETIDPYSVKALVTTEIIEKNKVAYMNIPSLVRFQIEPDMKVIKPFLQKVRNYQTLIIDIRGNGGGDSSYWSEHVVPMLTDRPLKFSSYLVYRGGAYSIPFIEAVFQKKFNDLTPIANIKKENLSALPPEVLTDFQRYVKDESVITPKNSVHFKGNIYLLVDGGVYSSSEQWAFFAEQSGWATLVGRRTGGDGIGFDPIMADLPNSGYVFQMSIDLGLKANGSIDEEVKVTPSILVTDPPQQPIAKDPAVLAVLKAEAERAKK